MPVGLLALVACHAFVHDPKYLVTQRNKLRRLPLYFDYIGLGLLSLATQVFATATFLEKCLTMDARAMTAPWLQMGESCRA